jgi:hypothetical protein
MPHREDHDLPAIEVIENDVATLAEFHDPFAKLRQHVLHGTPNLRKPAQGTHTLANGSDRSARRLGALRSEEIVQPRNVLNRRL